MSKNQLKDLPKEIGVLNNLQNLTISDNPLNEYPIKYTDINAIRQQLNILNRFSKSFARGSIQKYILKKIKKDVNPIESLICVICYLKLQFPLLLLRPCNHANICRDCIKKIATNCPTCRRDIKNIEKVYL